MAHVITAMVPMRDGVKLSTTVCLPEIDLWSIANCFRQGHRIRLEIAGSNFPQMARNNQTGNDPASDTELKVARQPATPLPTGPAGHEVIVISHF